MTDGSVSRFETGTNVVLRYITRMDGVTGMTWPCRVVRDDGDLLGLYIPMGCEVMSWRTPAGGTRELAPVPWRRDTLRLMFPAKGYSIWLFWEGEPRAFTTYYVNFEEPFRRTPVGFDTNDHALDILVAPDLTWAWKDRDEFAGLIASGHYSPEFGESVETAAAAVVEMIEAKAPPFDGAWVDWRPPADWTIPTMHPRWREEPARRWERCEWAYPHWRNR